MSISMERRRQAAVCYGAAMLITREFFKRGTFSKCSSMEPEWENWGRGGRLRGRATQMSSNMLTGLALHELCTWESRNLALQYYFSSSCQGMPFAHFSPPTHIDNSTRRVLRQRKPFALYERFGEAQIYTMWTICRNWLALDSSWYRPNW